VIFISKLGLSPIPLDVPPFILHPSAFLLSVKTITLPANYDVWLTELNDHLNRHRGSKTALARHLMHQRGLTTLNSAQAAVSSFASGKVQPMAAYFLDIATWLAEQQERGR
jgi:hypothetical protein